MNNVTRRIGYECTSTHVPPRSFPALPPPHGVLSANMSMAMRSAEPVRRLVYNYTGRPTDPGPAYADPPRTCTGPVQDPLTGHPHMKGPSTGAWPTRLAGDPLLLIPRVCWPSGMSCCRRCLLALPTCSLFSVSCWCCASFSLDSPASGKERPFKEIGTQLFRHLPQCLKFNPNSCVIAIAAYFRTEQTNSTTFFFRTFHSFFVVFARRERLLDAERSTQPSAPFQT